MRKVMVKGSYAMEFWYSKHIGEVFQVQDKESKGAIGESYITAVKHHLPNGIHNGHIYILKSDCELIAQENEITELGQLALF